MNNNNISGVRNTNQTLPLNEKPLESAGQTPKSKAPKTTKRAKTNRKDKVVLGAKVAGRLAKKSAAMMIPLGYRKLYRGEKLNKYDWIRTIGSTAIYAGGLVVGGPAGLAIVTGGRAVNYGSLGVQFRKELARLAKTAGRKLDPRKLAAAIKDGSAKKALSKLAHPKALAAAGVGAVTTLASSGLAAAVADTKNGHYFINKNAAHPGNSGAYNNMQVDTNGNTVPEQSYIERTIFTHDSSIVDQHSQIYLNNHADPVLISSPTTDEYVVQAHAELFTKDPTNAALAAAPASDQYVIACHAAIAAKNPVDPALVFSPSTDQYVAAAQATYDIPLDAQAAQEASQHAAQQAANQHPFTDDILNLMGQHPIEVGVVGVIVAVAGAIAVKAVAGEIREAMRPSSPKTKN